MDQKKAQNHADAAKRASDLQSAEADLAKAEMELRKGPLLSEIDRLKNEAKAADARGARGQPEEIERLSRSGRCRGPAHSGIAARPAEGGLDRAMHNIEKLQVHAPLAGMVALENVWRNGSMGHAQEGDQLWRGQALVRIFDPTEMEVRATVGEPDGAALQPGLPRHGAIWMPIPT